MAYYNWEKIVKSYSDKELRRVYREQNREPMDKVTAVVSELKNRGLLDGDNGELINIRKDFEIREVSEIAGRTEANKNAANFAIIAIGVILLLYVGSIISYIMQYELLISIKEGNNITEELAENNDHRVITLTYIIRLSYAISSLFFLYWFYTAYSNLEKRISKTKLTTAWSIIAWFVPIISLIRPLNIMIELNSSSDKVLIHRGEDLKKFKTPLIGLWWTLFILSIYISNFIVRMGLNYDLNNLILNTYLLILVSIIGIVLSIITIIMIRNFSEKESALFESENNINQYSRQLS